jgi:hypothetical protein
MKAATPWITYRTRFLVKAKQLNNSLSFTDALGRQHSGSKGDYLVESSEGLLSIAPRQIFEDIYVPLLTVHAATPENVKVPSCFTTQGQQETSQPRKTPQPSETLRRRGTLASFPLPPTFVRRTVQPYRDDRSTPGLRSV